MPFGMGYQPYIPPDKFVLQYREGLRAMRAGDRRQYYTSPQFEEDLANITRIVARMFDKEQAQILIEFGTKMRDAAQKMTPAQFSAISIVETLTSSQAGGEDTSDSFLMFVNGIADEVISRGNSQLAQNLLKQIDADFAKPIETLIEAIPSELEKSATLLDKAMKSFSGGHKEECALFTRMAWESAINFALSKLPTSKGLDSLGKKTNYVLDKMMQKDASKTITQVKNTVDVLFLHELDNEKVAIPELQLPFFIALTAALVHSIALMLA